MKLGSSIGEIICSFLGKAIVTGPYLGVCNKVIDAKTNKKMTGSYFSNRMLENSIQNHYKK